MTKWFHQKFRQWLKEETVSLEQRLLKLESRPPEILEKKIICYDDNKIEWLEEDAQNFQKFLETGSGKKLQKIMIAEAQQKKSEIVSSGNIDHSHGCGYAMGFSEFKPAIIDHYSNPNNFKKFTETSQEGEAKYLDRVSP